MLSALYKILIPVLDHTGKAGRTEDAENGVRILLEIYPQLTATKVREAMVFPDAEMNWICANPVSYTHSTLPTNRKA